MSIPFVHPLLVTEHSEFDGGAEALALAIARHCGAPLEVLLTLTSNPEYEALAPQVAALAEADAAARLATLQAWLTRQGASVALQVRRGPEPYREIVDEAAERGTDLIIIRRRGQRGLLANLLLGEMVRNVITHAPCSVLVAPRGAAMWSRLVLAALDPRTCDLAPIRLGAAVAMSCALPLWVVSVTEAASGAQRQEAEHALRTALAAARAHGANAEGCVLVGQAHQQIDATARELKADLLVVGRHGPEGLSRAWLGGVAQKVIGLAQCPVLVAIQPTQASSSAA